MWLFIQLFISYYLIQIYNYFSLLNIYGSQIYSYINSKIERKIQSILIKWDLNKYPGSIDGLTIKELNDQDIGLDIDQLSVS